MKKLLTDSIADFFIRMKNAKNAKHRHFTVSYSRITKAICSWLQRRAFIVKYGVIDTAKVYDSVIVVVISDNEGNYLFEDYRRISRPGKRVYCNCKMLKKHFSLMNGDVLVSTADAKMVTAIEAINYKIGGEVILNIW